MTSSGTRDVKCPVIDFQCSPPRKPAGESFFPYLDEVRRAAPVFWSTEGQGYWVLTRANLIAEVMQDLESFSCTATVPPTIPDPPYNWIPAQLDPPLHTAWRKLLGGWFSPGRVRSLESGLRERSREFINAIADKGSCEFIEDFAAKFPTSVFLQIVGMPPEELNRYMVWEKKILQPDAETDPGFVQMMKAIEEMSAHLGELIEIRRGDPSAQGSDIVTAALSWTIDGKPIPDQDLQNCLLLLFMAGLDTVTSQMSFLFQFLATNRRDRSRLVADPSLVPMAVEENLRAYSITRAGRKVIRDVNFHGHDFKAGDMVFLPLGFAGRDEEYYDRATEVDIDRPAFKNFAFGAGPHRCLGAHLARREMVIAVEEWHAQIPDYRIPAGANIVEHSGQVFGLDSLPLEWDVTYKH